MAQSRHPIDRAVLLHALAEPGAEPEGLPDEPLGRRNAALLRLRRAAFGDTMRAYVDCPGCGSRLEFELDAAMLLSSEASEAAPVVVGGWSFRPPSSRDLAAILEAPSSEKAVLRLLGLCAPGAGEFAVSGALEPLLDAVETALEKADPLADIVLDLRCLACAKEWAAPFDVAAFLWEEIDAYAARLLDEIHLLAGSYGWSEASILGLSDSRRAAYLKRVMA